MTTNPLLEYYTLLPMDKIKPEHFEPAINHAIASATAHIQALLNDPSPATFENTVKPIEAALVDIARIQELVCHYVDSHASDAMSAASEAVQLKVSTAKADLFQNPALAERFKSLPAPTIEEDVTLHTRLAHEFEARGAFLDDAGKLRLRAIEAELIKQSTIFNKNMDEAATANAVLVNDREELKGLPESAISAMRQSAQDAGFDTGWRLVPERLMIGSLLELAENRTFRERIFTALAALGTQEPNNNEAPIRAMQQLRHERAQLLGYPNHAAYAMARMMPTDVAEATQMLQTITDGALPKFEETVRTIHAYAREHGGPRTFEPWDIAYWATQYREAKYGFNPAEFSEYLPLDKALSGFFAVAESLFGLSITENASYPKDHADVHAYDVTSQKTGEHLGIFYTNLFARDAKRGGAWMLQLQPKSGDRPSTVSINMNLLKPADGTQPLLSLDDLETLFHEGGHALHGLLGTHTRHPLLQGANASSEYVEFFSNALQQWGQHPECIKAWAAHHETGAPIPDALLDARRASSTFFTEYSTLRVIENSMRDLVFHSMDPQAYTDTKSLHADADFKHPLAGHMGAYPLTRFTHMFGDGLSEYAAGYYGYIWSEALAQLGFAQFKQNGLYDPESAARLQTLYALGSSPDKYRAFSDLTGKPLTPQAMANAVLASIGADKPARVNRTGSEHSRS